MQKLDNTARSSPPRPRAYKPSAPSSPGRLRPSSAAAPLKPLEPRVTTYVNTRVTNMLLRLQVLSLLLPLLALCPPFPSPLCPVSEPRNLFLPPGSLPQSFECFAASLFGRRFR